MPKSATKCVGNVFYDARSEATSYNDRFGSREGVAEETGLERTRLARIELGVLDPYPEEVIIMASAYNAPDLENKYCSLMCPIGKKKVPQLEVNQSDKAVSNFMAAYLALKRSETSIEDLVISAAGNGAITEESLPILAHIIELASALSRRTQELALWAEKNTRKGEAKID